MAYDVVINVGLGVYDGSMRLLVEQGAHNSARGADAAGNAPLSPKQEEGPEVLQVGSMALQVFKVSRYDIAATWVALSPSGLHSSHDGSEYCC